MDKSRVKSFLVPVLAAVMVLILAPIRPAHAYIDPNVAGPLYQLLLPVLVAIGSGIAMVRRYLRHLWDRSIAACMSVFRGKTSSEDSNPQP
jgi:hypothetical protein